MRRNNREYEREPILVAGTGKLACSVAVCLVQAGHEVTLLTEAAPEAHRLCTTHVEDLRRETAAEPVRTKLRILSTLAEASGFALAIALPGESLAAKQALLTRLEVLLTPTATLALATESTPLPLLQQQARYPARIVGANWVEPAHTTCFLELVSNERTDPERVKYLYALAQTAWKKDPYHLSHGEGIRYRLVSALVREAFYLVENGYASVEDIDRACRNDAGYYLPFAGNCRYMDLMGTYAYGMVMKDLNRELANDQTVARFFTEVLAQGGRGMENNAGLYTYPEGEAAAWEETCRTFSYQIQQLMEKYPFHYQEAEVPLNP
ncbi:3-hydroxyacyl-CoA dehydrogenase family protein [Rhabdobacter roseus]|uniref:3-hydroxybutyryl-CoA dehydrogenase n=1 Tax=Rhabdobacter roseus TaxID=1655419 RepID=A0A840TLZ4_9BACT|nr:3-hydroxyacyl-CoA dehydrogenase NAD-binding domain-containing protein [Rhabdobacter roseus]MBB5284611.1 3-hydroxybutyryl-CoA dehydrogenase [Rhabdobacter roseus]